MSGADDDPTRVDARRPRSAGADDASTVVDRPARSSAPSMGATRREPLPELAGEATPITADTNDDSLPRSSMPRRSVLPPLSTTGGSAATATDAMQQQDLQRMRSFLRTAVPVCLVVAAPLPWLGGEFVAAGVFGLAMVISATAAFIVERQLRDPAAYTPARIMTIGYLLTAGAYCGIAYCGVFSPAAGVIPFGLFFFGLSWSFRGTFAIYLTCSIVYALLGGAIALGLMSDPGLVHADYLPLANRLALIGLAETVFFATYVVARFSRQATVDAINKHDAAVRALATREALLNEARFDLEGALRARGLGRFTDEVVGGYRLGTVLGRGGMGEVYDAVHLDTEEPAAVKLLQPQLLSDEDTVRRFWREFQLAAKLHVPNVVRVLETSDPGAAIPYIAMERLHGQDLADYLRAHGRMSMVDMLRFVRDVGVGLDAARDAGIVHRDIKPRNLFRAELPGGATLWKILDFGVSKLITEATQTKQNMVGTPTYMAPEQASGGEVSHLSDLYALGVIIYRGLTARPAFTGDSIAQILYQVINRMPPRPGALAKLSADVDAVLAIAIAKNAEDRFQSVGELADALDAAQRNRLSQPLRKRAARLLAANPWAKR